MGRPVSPHRWRLRLLIAFAAMGLAYVIFPWLIHGQASRSAPPPPVARGIPVVVAPAETGDIGVYLTGLGTATALKTVTVQSRVDGQLINVAFREGQLVRPGDLLAELDPRPFEVQLAQAEGQAAKDEAALENARVDLRRYQALVEEQSVALANQRTAVDITTRRLTASVLLIKALGGGWTAAQLPAVQ
jgi:membrane fusion protein, multidrug efflux system